jgi:hypothetical protein
MADVPDFLTLAHHRDLVGRERRPVFRWICLSLVGVFCLTGLANAYGQRPAASVVESPVARLEVSSPTRLRGGLYFQSRFRIDAREEIKKATLVLDPGWMEGMTMNTGEPSPIGEASRNGRIAFELGRIPKGSKYLFFLQFQVNPTTVGKRSNDVDLTDGETPLLHVDRTATVFP